MTAQGEGLTFVVEQGGQSIMDFVLPGQGSLVLGRSNAADIQIPDPGLSRKHCEILSTPQGVRVRDLGSSNGSFVNGRRISECPLNPTDVLAIGFATIRLKSAVGLTAPTGATPQAPTESAQARTTVTIGRVAYCADCGMPFELTAAQIEEKRSGRATFPCPKCEGRRQKAKGAGIAGYEILGKLGEGAMGAVYQARNTSTGELLVIKVLKKVQDPLDLQFFFREARAVTQLDHPNIVRIFEVGEEKGHPFIAMEYLDGGNLRDRIEQQSKLSPRQVAAVLLSIGRALQHAYERNIVHRDIKPDNVFVTRSGIIKLGDFGLAKDMTEAGQSGLTEPGEGRGTPLYMPPEQIDNAVNADTRADIYSLGATCYHALAGRPPFLGDSLRVICHKVAYETPPPLKQFDASIPEPMIEVIERMLQKDPADRYQTPDDFVSVVERLVGI